MLCNYITQNLEWNLTINGPKPTCTEIYDTFMTCDMFSDPSGVPLIDDFSSCSCVPAPQTANCDHINGVPVDASYDWQQCPQHIGGLRFSGCDKWVTAGSDGAIYNDGESLPSPYPTQGDPCLDNNDEVYDVVSSHISFDLQANNFQYDEFGNVIGSGGLAPDYWRFFEDPVWNVANGKPINPVKYPIGLNWPNGPWNGRYLTGATVASSFDWLALFGGNEPDIFLDQWGYSLENVGGTFDYFVNLGEEYFYRIAHNKRRQTFGCAETFMGVNPDEEANCGSAALVDVSLRTAAEAPMLVIRLHVTSNPVGNDPTNPAYAFNRCYWWTLQLAEGPCAGYFFDQNKEVIGGVTFYRAKWSQTERYGAFLMDNYPGTAEFVNLWNAEVNQSIFRFYMPYYNTGHFQIPAILGDLSDGNGGWSLFPNYIL